MCGLRDEGTAVVKPGVMPLLSSRETGADSSLDHEPATGMIKLGGAKQYHDCFRSYTSSSDIIPALQ